MDRDGHAPRGRRAPEDAAVGLCAECSHSTTQKSARGSVFWRCLAAEGDPRLLRYPPLPVTRCHAFQQREAH